MTARDPEIDAIISLVGYHGHVRVRDLVGRDNPAWLRPLRQAAMFVAQRQLRATHAAIGAHFGRSPSFAQVGLNAARRRVRADPAFGTLVERVVADLWAERLQ